jgi:hypothetical protein
MVRKNNDNHDTLRQRQQQQQQHGPPPQLQQLQRYGSAINNDLIELNADGTRRNNSHLKISPASAFKKASVKHHSNRSNSSSGLLPLVFVDDDDDDDDNNHNNDEQGGGGGGADEHDPHKVIRALFKSHKGEQQQQQQQQQEQEQADDVPPEAAAAATATTTLPTTASSASSASASDSAATPENSNSTSISSPPPPRQQQHVQYTLENADKRAKHKLLAFLLQESEEWKQLFPILLQGGRDSSLGDDDDDDDDFDFDVEMFMNSTNETTHETPLHTVCWKGPSQLALLMLETIPHQSLHQQQQRQLALLQRDAHGNTPLHLACAHLDHRVDFTVIKNLLLLAPEALE